MAVFKNWGVQLWGPCNESPTISPLAWLDSARQGLWSTIWGLYWGPDIIGNSHIRSKWPLCCGSCRDVGPEDLAQQGTRKMHESTPHRSPAVRITVNAAFQLVTQFLLEALCKMQFLWSPINTASKTSYSVFRTVYFRVPPCARVRHNPLQACCQPGMKTQKYGTTGTR